MLLYNIPDELIINADQTPSRYVATDDVKMVVKGGKYISRTGSSDKRSISLTLRESHNRTTLSFRLIYEGQERYQILVFLTVFSLSHKKNPWSNETETICFINDVLVPYIKRVKEEETFPRDQKIVLIWDAFKAQSTTKVEGTLASYGIETVLVPWPNCYSN